MPTKLISLIEGATKEKGFIVLRRARPLIRFRRIMQRQVAVGRKDARFRFYELINAKYKETQATTKISCDVSFPH